MKVSFNCPFCDYHINTRSFIETKYSKAIIAKDHIYKGQSLVIPIRHVEKYTDLSDEEITDMALCCKLALKALKSSLGIENYNVVLNNGNIAGQTVPHVHFHIIPRIEKDIHNPKYWLSQDLFALLKERSKDEMIEEASFIKTFIKFSPINNHLNDLELLESGSNVKIASTVKMFGRVKIGANSIIEDNVILGNHNYKSLIEGNNSSSNDYCVTIGDNAIVRSGTVIYSSVKIGNNFDCGHNVVIRECSRIGDDCYFYPGTQIHRNVSVGNKCRISGWVGNHVIINNNVSTFGSLVHKFEKREAGHIEEAPVLMDNTMVGWNAIIIGGVRVGYNATVGAGAVVINDVVENTTVMGNPAKLKK